MTNMSYCRFQNTLGDLQDCYDNMDELGPIEDAGETERREIRCRKRLVALCKRIADDYHEEFCESEDAE